MDRRHPPAGGPGQREDGPDEEAGPRGASASGSPSLLPSPGGSASYHADRDDRGEPECHHHDEQGRVLRRADRTDAEHDDADGQRDRRNLDRHRPRSGPSPGRAGRRRSRSGSRRRTSASAEGPRWSRRGPTCSLASPAMPEISTIGSMYLAERHEAGYWRLADPAMTSSIATRTSAAPTGLATE